MNKLLQAPISALIILLNLLVFLALKLAPELQNLFILHSLNATSPLAFILCAFSHTRLWHLALNMLMLLALGSFLEGFLRRNFGPVKATLLYLALYSLSLAASSLSSVLYVQIAAPAAVLGASGAVFGLFAAYALLHGDLRAFFLQLILIHAAILAADLPFAWFAHLAGAAAGLLMALCLKPLIRS